MVQPGHNNFGDKLPALALADPNSFFGRGDKGLCLIDNEWVFVAKTADVAAYIQQVSASVVDSRLYYQIAP